MRPELGESVQVALGDATSLRLENTNMTSLDSTTVDHDRYMYIYIYIYIYIYL